MRDGEISVIPRRHDGDREADAERFLCVPASQPQERQRRPGAYNALNCKRCALLLADRRGFPVVALEYQGSGHGIGSTAEQRDDIKRQALERAGVRYREIREGTTPDEMQQIRTS
jgi:Protein of unknown function (DUF2726)